MSPLSDSLHPDGPLLRRLALLGSTRGPAWLLRGAPPVLGALFWALRGRHRRGVQHNLRRIHGPRSPLAERRDEIATFIGFARSLAEGMAALGDRREQVRVEVSGAEHLLENNQGRGAILLTAHTSSFELAGAALGSREKLDIVMVMRAESNSQARQISDELRRRGGLHVVHVGDDLTAGLTLAAHLRRGACLATQIDRVPPGMKGLPVQLFGQPALLPLGPFALARATGAPLVPVFTRRTGFLAAEVRVFPAISVPRRATRAEMEGAARRVAGLFESWIRAYPTEWFDWGEGVLSPPAEGDAKRPTP